MELPGLQTMRFLGSHVTDRGLEHLKRLTSLREMELRFTPGHRCRGQRAKEGVAEL